MTAPDAAHAAALVDQLGLADRVVDEKALAASVARCRERKVVLPTFAQLADPRTIDASITHGVDKNAADPRNLFRVHWYNDMSGARVAVPDTWCCRRRSLASRARSSSSSATVSR